MLCWMPKCLGACMSLYAADWSLTGKEILILKYLFPLFPSSSTYNEPSPSAQHMHALERRGKEEEGEGGENCGQTCFPVSTNDMAHPLVQNCYPLETSRSSRDLEHCLFLQIVHGKLWDNSKRKNNTKRNAKYGD